MLGRDGILSGFVPGSEPPGVGFGGTPRTPLSAPPPLSALAGAATFLSAAAVPVLYWSLHPACCSCHAAAPCRVRRRGKLRAVRGAPFPPSCLPHAPRKPASKNPLMHQGIFEGRFPFEPSHVHAPAVRVQGVRKGMLHPTRTCWQMRATHKQCAPKAEFFARSREQIGTNYHLARRGR